MGAVKGYAGREDVSFRLHDGMKLAVEKFSIIILLTTFRYRWQVTNKTTVIPAVAATLRGRRGRKKLQRNPYWFWESVLYFSHTWYNLHF
jgi:hypothetical protein